MGETTNLKNVLLISVLLMATTCSIAAGKIIYVDDDANGLNDGSSWANAYIDLQDALTVAVFGDEIRVAQGIHKPHFGGGNTPGNRTATFRLKNGVAIKGGYAGFGEPDPDARDIEVHETVLSGDLSCDDLPRYPYNTDDNSFHVVNGSGTDATAVLDGFIITAGNANQNYPSPYGDGGGMYNYHSSPTLNNCTFSRNSAGWVGGGIFNEFSSPTLTNCTFSWNEAVGGGGMYNYNSSPMLSNCEFNENSGGGMLNGISSPTLNNCTFIANSAGNGGGMCNYESSSPKLTNCTFNGNSSFRGGGMYNVSGSSPMLANCILWKNTAHIESPQIHNDEISSATVRYSDVQGGWPGAGNINANPLFVDPAIGDYHLLPGSPCIDAGHNFHVPPSVVTDMDGNYRIANGTVDMGVYEFGSTPPPSTLFVDARATGANDGSSWVDAFTDLQESLTFATAFPKVEEIRVAQGVYTPEGPPPDIRQASNPNPADGARSVSLTADLSWMAGSDATSHDVYFGATSPPPFIQNQIGTTFDPGMMAYSTVYYWRIDEVDAYGTVTGVIWSFKTTGPGPGSPPPLPPPLDRTATFKLKNGVVIKGGYAGFGQPDPNARDIDKYKTILSGDLKGDDGPDFANNDENSYHVVTGSGTDETAVLDGFTITAGHANGSNPEDRGAGMTNDSGSPTLINCTFVRNWAHYAAGIANKNGSNPTLTNCTFRDNLVVASGGAVYNWNHSNSTLTNCTFSGNSAPDGAAMFIYNSRPTLTNCLFGGNSSQHNGGALYLRLSNPTLTNCTFSGNSAGGDGGGMYNENSNPTVTNCTFSSNSAIYWGGGMFNVSESSPTLANCILWGNTASNGSQIHNHDGTSSATVSYSDVQGGWPGQGNIDAEPCFVEPGFWDANGIWIDGDYHLLPTSPCIDAGDPDYIAEPNETDLDGKPRVIGGRIDMGAYEFQNTPPVADTGPDLIIECACNTEEGTKVTLDGTGSYDADGDPLTYTWTGPFIESPVHGATPTVALEGGCPGEYVITLVVNDGIDESEPNDVVITVVDTTPPEFEFSVTPTMLWPPDHKMVKITPSWTVSDDCDSAPQVSLVGIVMSEDDNTVGDGHTTNDIQIGEDGSIYLRSERSGASGDRIYTITYQAVDDCGNTTVRSATVSIPHDFKVLARIASRWLWANPSGRIPEDLNSDGFVNLKDIAIFANNWIQ